MKKMILATSAVYLSLCAVGFAAESPSRAGNEVERTQIQQLNEQFSKAFDQGDVRQIENMYADDAAVLPPGENVIRGKDQIGNFLRTATQQFEDLKLNTQDVRQLGSNAIREIGTFTMKVKQGSQSSSQQSTNPTTTKAESGSSTSSSRSGQSSGQNLVSDMGIQMQPGQEVRGKYVVVWEKEGNSWKLGTDIWNNVSSNSNR